MDCFLENLVLVLSNNRDSVCWACFLPVPEMSWEKMLVVFWTGCVTGTPVKSLWMFVSDRTLAH